MSELVPDPRWLLLAGAGILAFALPLVARLRRLGRSALEDASTLVTSHVAYFACVLLGYRFSGLRGALGLLVIWALLTVTAHLTGLLVSRRAAALQRLDGPSPRDAPSEPRLANRMVQLHAGWNLISVPLRPLNDRCDRVLGTELPYWGWDARHRRYLRPEHLSAGYALWILADSDRALTFYGYPVEPSSRRLQPGWNLIGPTEPRIAPRHPALRGTVWGFEEGRFAKAERLVPGRGYWIWAEDAVDLLL